MTVVENLLTGRHARIRTNPLAEMLFLPSVRREEVRQREAVEKIIEFVELERYRRAPVGTLPFGIQKIVGFARALALEPAVLLLDEPSAGLNREEREDLARFILRIKHELGIAMIWIEHDMQMVADLADRIHVLDYGRASPKAARTTCCGIPMWCEPISASKPERQIVRRNSNFSFLALSGPHLVSPAMAAAATAIAGYFVDVRE